jgi:2-(1,2-epoxy-1,2-dihydrophenyl)acetyl-CoA isomerase
MTGAGDQAFCAGGDVSAFAADPDHVDTLIRQMTKHVHGAVLRFSQCNAPVIAAVNGTVAGGGFGLFASADLAITVDTAKFTSAYTKIGLTPDGSSTFYLARILGRRRAMEFVLTNRVLSAAEALEWGLVNKVVPADRLLAEASAMAAMLASGPTLAHGAVKRLLYSSPDESLERQMEHEADSISGLSRSADGLEGVAAFMEKRRPRFTGR